MMDAFPEGGPAEIPDKLYFKIGEVSAMLGVQPHVVRYWETEFPRLSPKKSGTGRRLYQRKDIEMLLRIKHLLYEKRFTIAGARQTLDAESRAPRTRKKASQQSLFSADPLPEIRRALQEIVSLLK